MLTPQLDIYTHLGPKVKGMQVLEVGFGTGLGTLQLVARAHHVTAIELDSEAVAFAARVLPKQARWFQADILTAQYASQFNAVVMIEVLEHIRDYRRALENIRLALRPGGVLYMSARNAHADLRRNELHEREWTAAQLTEALSEYFSEVNLWDYTLTEKQTTETRMTPLVAEARK